MYELLSILDFSMHIYIYQYIGGGIKHVYFHPWIKHSNIPFLGQYICIYLTVVDEFSLFGGT